MPDYEPMDLTPYCNAGTDLLAGVATPDTGLRDYRGLPFLIGQDDKQCFIFFDKGASPITVNVGNTAHQVLFAHRLLESNLDNTGPVGLLVADYVFKIRDQDEVIVPVRERFEISTIPMDSFNRDIGPSGLPFIAVTDNSHQLMPREVSRWIEHPENPGYGWKQTESVQGSATNYVLWTWKNLWPGQIVEYIKILPRGPRFLIAGITLGHLDEHPFVRQGRREVGITFTDSESSQDYRNIEVSVNRGDATYVFPLPLKSADEFIHSYHKGFGEPRSDTGDKAYVEISAIPSAKISVSRDSKVKAQFPWSEIQSVGNAQTPDVRLDLLDKGRNWVKVTVLDDSTNEAVPCRIHFRSPEGIPYQPHGHHNQVNSGNGTWHIDVGGDVRLGHITYAYIDGKCQGWLPRGEVIVDVARGYEYEPIRTKVHIKPGQSSLTLRIKRWKNMNSQGWYSGDSHVHFLSTQGAHTESRSEDLNVVNLLQSQWGSLFTNTEDFTGHASVHKDGTNIVYVSQENRQHFMGHMIMWGLKEPVMPWGSDGPAEAEIGGHMETTLAHWADAAHAQGAWVINPHFPNPNGEPAALVATGRLDGVEMLRQTKPHHMEYYRYLNNGYRLPLVGGTDKMSSDVPVGLYRTYARIPESQEFSYENWCKAVAAGRCFLSGGPIITFSVEGKDIGDTVNLRGPGTVEVQAIAECIFPMYSLEIVQNGKVVARTQQSRGSHRLSIREKLKVNDHSWIAARCGALDYFDIIPHHDVWHRGIFAHTSPIYVACDGEWEMYDRMTSQYMLTLIEGDLEYIRYSSGIRPVDSITHHHGEKNHMAYLQRPFEEAREAILGRMKKNR